MRLSHLGVAALLSAASGTRAQEYEPEVNLGYAIHRATTYGDGAYHAFNNIRYAEPPVGDLRFQLPVEINDYNQTVVDGSYGFHCPQAYPEWVIAKAQEEDGGPPSDMTDDPPVDPLASEDCLFLDVHVPSKVLSEANNGRRCPVLIWLHGGGFTFGMKDDDSYNPTGILERALKQNGDCGVVFVSINYRLGLFGWLNGDGDEDIEPNLGLRDQLHALEWVQQHIHLFGGDKDKVTVMGQSAGAGSIAHHMTAENGQRTPPFHRAIIQSPGWDTVNVPEVWSITLAVASEIAGRPITSGKDLRGLDYETLNKINNAIVFKSPSGSFTYSPTVDNNYVVDDPSALFWKGNFADDLQVMVGHNLNEAGLFVSPEIDTREKLQAVLLATFSDLEPEFVDHLLTQQYPEPGADASLGYTDQYGRAVLLFSEASFNCHTSTIALAYNTTSFGYRFQVSPGVHAQDVPWTFYHGEEGGEVSWPLLAEYMQYYFTAFAQTGDPNGGGMSLLSWPPYMTTGTIAALPSDWAVVATDKDDALNKRCEFWGRGDYRQKWALDTDA